MILIALLKILNCRIKYVLWAIFIKMLLQGSTIKEASEAVGVARQTGSIMAKKI